MSVADENSVQKVSVELPVADCSMDGYISRRVEVNLKLEQAMTLRRLLRGFDESGVKLRDGEFVRRPQDVFRWILEQIGDGFETGDVCET